MNLQKMLTPIWQGDTIYAESVMPVMGGDGRVCARLLLIPDEIIKIQRACGKRIKNYKMCGDGVIEFDKDEVTYVTESLICGDDIPASLGTQPRAGGGSIPFTETAWIHNRHISISYRHNAFYPAPENKSGLLPETEKKLKNGSLSITLYGDSIAAGANASALMRVPPFHAPMCDLIRSGLELRTGARVSMTNIAVGGTDTKWGLETMPEKEESLKSDLVILAFGMNDGTGRRPVSEYIQNTVSMIEYIKNINPAAEFVLVSSMRPNDLTTFLGNQPEYAPALKALARTGIAFTDMYSFHCGLLARKHYMDMTGNNINHPNDFLIRCYVMNILETILA